MSNKIVVSLPAALVLECPSVTIQGHRVGLIQEGGPFNAVIDGLKPGLKELGLEERQSMPLRAGG